MHLPSTQRYCDVLFQMMRLRTVVSTLNIYQDCVSSGADPEIGHGGLNFGRFFRMKTTKLCTHKAPKKKRTNLHN